MKARALLFACISLLGLVAAPSPSAAWCRMTTSRTPPSPSMPCVTDGIPLAWRRRCMAYAVYAGGSRDMSLEQVEQIVGASFGSWLSVDCGGQTTGLDVRELTAYSNCNEAQYDREGPNANNIVFVSDWAQRGYDSSAYALTTVWHNTRTGEIYDVDMEINEDRGPYGVCPAETGCVDGTVDLQNVVTHEAGHFFAMAHTPNSPVATMYAVSPPGEVGKRILRTDDIEGFCQIYPPGTLPVQCDFQAKNGTSLECADLSGSCGCSVPGAGHERGWMAALALLGLTAFVRRRRSA